MTTALTPQTARSLATRPVPLGGGVAGVSLSPIGHGQSRGGTGYAAFSCPQQTSLAIGITSVVRAFVTKRLCMSPGKATAKNVSVMRVRRELNKEHFIGVDLSFRGNQ